MNSAEFAKTSPTFGKLGHSRQITAQKYTYQNCRQKCSKRYNTHKINNPQKRAEYQSMRPPRPVLKEHLVRKPERFQYPPARILLRNRVKVGPEHQSAKKKR